VYWKRYAFVFAAALIVANAYTFWPAFAYANTAINCPGIFGNLSYNVEGAAKVVGAPLYSEMQLVMQPGSTSYETAVYQSANNNLTQLFQYDYPVNGSDFTRAGWNPVTQYLDQINGFDGLTNQVMANATGVTITFQNITFEGIHVAKILYKITASSSAVDGSYEIGGAPCWTGLVLTVGYLPYFGPLAFGDIQQVGIIINNSIAVIGSTILCLVLKFYWSRQKTRLSKNVK
jgi:hypothetical protein